MLVLFLTYTAKRDSVSPGEQPAKIAVRIWLGQLPDRAQLQTAVLLAKGNQATEEPSGFFEAKRSFEAATGNWLARLAPVIRETQE